MIQSIIALAIIIGFLLRLGWQFYKDQMPKSQFIFWLIFWFIAGLLVVFIRYVDQLALKFGFSSSGIQLLLYVAMVVIIYVIFRLRLKVSLLEKDITTLTRHLALNSDREEFKEKN